MPNRYTLPKAEKSAGILSKNFVPLQKEHRKNECWSLHGRPEKDHNRQSQQEANTKKYINTADKRQEKRSESEDSFISIEKKGRSRKTRASRKH